MGRRIIAALSYISVRMEKKKQQQQRRVGFKKGDREQWGSGAVQRQMPRGGVVGDEAERHDFRSE